MISEIVKKYDDVFHATQYQPAISIILPFEPKMSLKSELQHRLKLSIEKVKNELIKNYTRESYMPVLQKLHSIEDKIDFSSYKKSLAIFVSPVFEKVYYLDIPVEEKIIIDGSFEIRDLVYSKKEMHKYLVLVLSAKKAHIYLGNTTTFVRIVTNIPEHIAAYSNDIPERVANFSDPSERKEVMLDKFLRHIDDSLSIILKAYPLPLFLVGPERVIGHFKGISHNINHIISYVHGNYDDASEEELRNLLRPEVKDWKKVKEEDLLHQLDTAVGARKLSVGIEKVWNTVSQKKGRLLVVEKNYIYPTHLGGEESLLYEEEGTSNGFYIKDAVDDIIEKVLETGGDVEFVDEGVLNNYQRIALIQYY